MYGEFVAWNRCIVLFAIDYNLVETMPHLKWSGILINYKLINLGEVVMLNFLFDNSVKYDACSDDSRIYRISIT